MDYLASMYIDNELDLGEKVLFIEKIRSEKEFFQETVDLLNQEKILRIQPQRLLVLAERRIRPASKSRMKKLFRPMVGFGAGIAFTFLLFFHAPNDSMDQQSTVNRFVIFEPAVSRVELTGTFNGWQRIQMNQVGDTGYWELNLQLPAGEHKFAYILDGARRMADPTQPAKEKDDFGGENSVLKVAARA